MTVATTKNRTTTATAKTKTTPKPRDAKSPAAAGTKWTGTIRTAMTGTDGQVVPTADMTPSEVRRWQTRATKAIAAYRGGQLTIQIDGPMLPAAATATPTAK